MSEQADQFAPASPDTDVVFENGKPSRIKLFGKDLSFHFEGEELVRIEIPAARGKTLTILPQSDKYMTAELR